MWQDCHHVHYNIRLNHITYLPYLPYLPYLLSLHYYLRMSDVLIFGARGFLGSEIHKLYPDCAVPSCDIADPQAVREVLDREKP